MMFYVETYGMPLENKWKNGDLHVKHENDEQAGSNYQTGGVIVDLSDVSD